MDRTRRWARWAVPGALVWAWALVGCDGSGGATRLKDPKAKAAALWETRCAPCHGVRGQGDGPSVPGIRITPADMSQRSWQAAWDDAKVRRVILQGGPSEGRSPVMSPNPDLVEEPEVVDELVRIIRGLEAAPPAAP